jgi:predicted transcriptional regulator of viral defense system
VTTIDAYADLVRYGKPIVATAEVVARLRLSRSAATQTLKRLARAGLLLELARGLFSIRRDVNPLLVPEYLTAPLPAYVSFQTALYLHGMIEQIPHVIYVASLARTRVVEISRGTYSIHRLGPEFFGGYDVTDSGVHLASPEKALLDVLYLANARSRLFARLPELALPRRFSERRARRWIGRIASRYRRTMVDRRLEGVLATARCSRKPI